MKIVAIYPGRFQPFGPHHYKAFQWLQNKFGKSDTYIATSNKTDNVKSPLDFTEKQSIIKKYGIPSTQIVQVKNPYISIEILSKYPEDTAVVFMYGEKDAGRLQYTKKDGSQGYFMKYEDAENLENYKTRGYVVVAPHVNIELPGYGEMSGTALREFIPYASDEAFKKFFGWYDSRLVAMMRDKFMKLRENLKEGNDSTAAVDDGPRFMYGDIASYKNSLNSTSKKLKDWTIADWILGDVKSVPIHDTEWPKGPVPAVSFFPAGSAGHGTDYFEASSLANAYKEWVKHVDNLVGDSVKVISYIDDESSLPMKESKNTHTMNELKHTDGTETLNEGGAFGHLSHPYDDSAFTFKDFEELIDRSLRGELDIEGDVQEKTDGQNLMITYKNGKIGAARNKSTIFDPMSAEDIADKFQGRGNIETAFVSAMNDLEKALKSIDEDSLNTIFKNGLRFLNIEVIFPSTRNVIDYGQSAYLVFLGMVEFDESGKPVKNLTREAARLQKIIEKVNANVQDTFTIIAPKILKLSQTADFESKSPYFKNKLADIYNGVGLKVDSTLRDYFEEKFSELIDEKFLVSDAVKDILIKRWVDGDKSVRMTQSNMGSALKEIQTYEKSDLKSDYARFSYPIQTLFLELGVEVMKNINDFLTASPSQTIRTMRNDLAELIRKAKSTNDPKVLSALTANLKKIKALGGFDKIIPAEGIVFNYKGRLLKFTGTFAPINQLLGIFRYSR